MAEPEEEEEEEPHWFPPFVVDCPDEELRERAKKAYLDEEDPDRDRLLQLCIERTAEDRKKRNLLLRKTQFQLVREFIRNVDHLQDPNPPTPSEHLS